MARPWDELQTILQGIIGEGNSCYFQPPDDIYLTYPAIVYDLSNDDVDYANNKKYRYMKRYEITIMTEEPDSDIPDLVGELEYCRFVRHYSQNNLHHFIYEIYF